MSPLPPSLERTQTLTNTQVTTYDPLVVFGEDGALSHSGCELQKPTFFQKPEDLPAATKAMMETIIAADCVLCISPEYNHGIHPALASMRELVVLSHVYACIHPHIYLLLL